jgi:hypothetical protein
MKCAFNPCGEVNHLPIKLTLPQGEQHFCGYPHLFCVLVHNLDAGARAAISQALNAVQSPTGRKALISYLVEKCL